MLNDNYGGGELYFENEGLELKTPPGSLIYFRGDRQTLHGVREITSGERINMVIFFRDYDK
jgi:predicted 2-oxoglutarate/Fe(II)-dependent dioxygenase YbiX